MLDIVPRTEPGARGSRARVRRRAHTSTTPPSVGRQRGGRRAAHPIRRLGERLPHGRVVVRATCQTGRSATSPTRRPSEHTPRSRALRWPHQSRPSPCQATRINVIERSERACGHGRRVVQRAVAIGLEGVRERGRGPTDRVPPDRACQTSPSERCCCSASAHAEPATGHPPVATSGRGSDCQTTLGHGGATPSSRRALMSASGRKYDRHRDARVGRGASAMAADRRGVRQRGALDASTSVAATLSPDHATIAPRGVAATDGPKPALESAFGARPGGAPLATTGRSSPG